MKSKAILMALAMMAGALAGCSGDPDGGGNDEFDAATLQGMIEAGLQDFMNNTTVDITTIHYTNETSSTTNYINGSGGSSSTIHVLAGTSQGESSMTDPYAVNSSTTSRQVNPTPSVTDDGMGWSVLNLTIAQEHGEMSNMIGIYAVVTMVGTCVNNVSSNNSSTCSTGDIISQNYDFRYGSTYTNPIFWGENQVDPAISTQCELGFDHDLNLQTTFGPPGIECDLTISMYVEFSDVHWYYSGFDTPTAIEEYDFIWSDWTYYVIWESTPVTMHE